MFHFSLCSLSIIWWKLFQCFSNAFLYENDDKFSFPMHFFFLFRRLCCTQFRISLPAQCEYGFERLDSLWLTALSCSKHGGIFWKKNLKILLKNSTYETFFEATHFCCCVFQVLSKNSWRTVSKWIKYPNTSYIHLDPFCTRTSAN